MIGCHIVEIDTREELDRALEEPVAMVVLLGKQEHLSAVRLEEIASVCKPRGIPIMVDAASEHIERPSPWLKRGADLVDLQRRQVPARAADQRPAARQQAAVPGGVAQRLAASGAGPADEGVEGGHRRRRRRARILVRRARRGGRARANGMTICATIAERLGAARRRARRGARAERGRQGAAAQDRLGPRALSARRPRAARRGARRRAAGHARRQFSATDNSIAIDPFQLQPGEAAQVGDAIVAALRASLTNRPPATRAPAPADRRRVGIAGRLHARRAHASPRARTAGRRHRRAAALGAVRRAGQRRDRRRPRSASRSTAATRRARSPIASRAGSRTARWQARCCSAPPATRTSGIVNRTQFGAGSWRARRVG